MIAAGWLDRRIAAAPAAGGLLTARGRPGPARRLRLAPAPRVVIVADRVPGRRCWLWLRDSSLVAVKRVTVTGASGPDAAQIRSALDGGGAQHDHARRATWRARTPSSSPTRSSRRLRVSTQFPHGMTDPRHRGGAGGGDHVRRSHASPWPPTARCCTTCRASRPLPIDPAAGRPRWLAAHRSPPALRRVAVLAAAPYALLAHVSRGHAPTSAHGLVAQLRDGPSIYFGTDDRLAREVGRGRRPCSPTRARPGRSYIDVTDPERPAAGAALASSAGSAGVRGHGSDGRGHDDRRRRRPPPDGNASAVERLTLK